MLGGQSIITYAVATIFIFARFVKDNLREIFFSRKNIKIVT